MIGPAHAHLVLAAGDDLGVVVPITLNNPQELSFVDAFLNQVSSHENKPGGGGGVRSTGGGGKGRVLNCCVPWSLPFNHLPRIPTSPGGGKVDVHRPERGVAAGKLGGRDIILPNCNYDFYSFL